MSKSAVEALVEKMLNDETFAELLSTDPDQALLDFDLSTEEIAAVKAMGDSGKSAVAEHLDRRIVKTDSDAKSDGNQGDADETDDEWWIGSVTD